MARTERAKAGSAPNPGSISSKMVALKDRIPNEAWPRPASSESTAMLPIKLALRTLGSGPTNQVKSHTAPIINNVLGALGIWNSRSRARAIAASNAIFDPLTAVRWLRPLVFIASDNASSWPSRSP
ncbi:hypothetical protein AAHB37_09405 [Glutamicibacter halophytocola]